MSEQREPLLYLALVGWVQHSAATVNRLGGHGLPAVGLGADQRCLALLKSNHLLQTGFYILLEEPGCLAQPLDWRYSQSVSQPPRFSQGFHVYIQLPTYGLAATTCISTATDQPRPFQICRRQTACTPSLQVQSITARMRTSAGPDGTARCGKREFSL